MVNITPALLEGIALTSQLWCVCVCVLSNTFLLNILIQSQFPKENFLLKFLDVFTRECKKAKIYLLELRGRSKICL